MKSLWLCVFLLAGTGFSHPQTAKPAKKNRQAPLPSIQYLSLDDILSWRSKYGFLVGMKEDQVMASLGDPAEREVHSDDSYLTFQSAKTDGRVIGVRIAGGTVSAVYVHRKTDEVFDVSLIFVKADQFKFSSGVFEDSTQPFVVAEKGNVMIRIRAYEVSEHSAFSVVESVILVQ